MEIISRYIILGSFCCSGLSLIIILIMHRIKGVEFLGISTTGTYMFIAGKIGIFGSWAMFIISAIVPEAGLILLPPVLILVVSVLLVPLTLLFNISMFTLGRSLKMGLTKEPTKLRTSGPFSFSRNPMYLAAFGMCLLSCIAFVHPVNVLLAVTGIYIHHRTILLEEKFLESRFGPEWGNYASKVRRYL